MDRLLFEKRVYSKGYRRIAGVDEAGRGPLAGPVVAAACILPPHFALEGIDDSKKLSFNERSCLYEQLISYPDLLFGVGVAESGEIDAINILQATFCAMRRAVEALAERPDYLLVDGPYLPHTEIAGKGVIRGDGRSLTIGAASILAKHYRDLLMMEYHALYPCYGFDKHKGYGTKAHIEALTEYGPSPIHRRSFRPVASLVEGALHGT